MLLTFNNIIPCFLQLSSIFCAPVTDLSSTVFDCGALTCLWLLVLVRFPSSPNFEIEYSIRWRITASLATMMWSLLEIYPTPEPVEGWLAGTSSPSSSEKIELLLINIDIYIQSYCYCHLGNSRGRGRRYSNCLGSIKLFG